MTPQDVAAVQAAFVKAMVDKFLCWNLPQDFNPDAGISFTKKPYHAIAGGWPVGTNLLTATQATEMFAACLPPNFFEEWFAERERLVWECQTMAATQCESPSAGEYGDMVCLKVADLQRRLAEAEARARELEAHINIKPPYAGFMEPPK